MLMNLATVRLLRRAAFLLKNASDSIHGDKAYLHHVNAESGMRDVLVHVRDCFNVNGFLHLGRSAPTEWDCSCQEIQPDLLA